MKRILIVDDERIIRESLKISFERYFNVDTAATGKGAYKAVYLNNYHGILIDIHLEGSISGIELAKRFRSKSTLLKLVIISATHFDELTVKSAQSIDAKFFEKPLDQTKVQAICEIIDGE